MAKYKNYRWLNAFAKNAKCFCAGCENRADSEQKKGRFRGSDSGSLSNNWEIIEKFEILPKTKKFTKKLRNFTMSYKNLPRIKKFYQELRNSSKNSEIYQEPKNLTKNLVFYGNIDNNLLLYDNIKNNLLLYDNIG